MKLGNFKFHSIETGRFALDGGAMFGVIPKVLWSKTNPADESNRIDMALRSLLVEYQNRLILIDTGMGNNWSDRHKKMYKLDLESTNLDMELKKRSFSRSDITDILITHLHFDHTGGSVLEKDGTLIPAFPNATYHVSKSNWDWAMNPMEKDRASYLKDSFYPLKEHGVLNLVDDFSELNMDSLSSVKSDGHTIGMLLPVFSGEGRSLVYGADLIPTSSHIAIPYVMGYDLQPMISIEEKKELIAKIVFGRDILFFEHDAKVAAGTVICNERGKYCLGEEIKV